MELGNNGGGWVTVVGGSAHLPSTYCPIKTCVGLVSIVPMSWLFWSFLCTSCLSVSHPSLLTHHTESHKHTHTRTRTLNDYLGPRKQTKLLCLMCVFRLSAHVSFIWTVVRGSACWMMYALCSTQWQRRGLYTDIIQHFLIETNWKIKCW